MQGKALEISKKLAPQVEGTNSTGEVCVHVLSSTAVLDCAGIASVGLYQLTPSAPWLWKFSFLVVGALLQLGLECS